MMKFCVTSDLDDSASLLHMYYDEMERKEISISSLENIINYVDFLGEVERSFFITILIERDEGEWWEFSFLDGKYSSEPKRIEEFNKGL